MDLASRRQVVDVDAAPTSARGPGCTSAFFRDLFDREVSYVWTSLQRLGVPERDREDLTNEVFFRVHQRLGEYDRSRPIRPWLFAFVVRVTGEYRRRPRHRFEELGGEGDARDGAVSPPRSRSDAEEMARVALESLEIDKRAVLLLHDLDGHSAAEIAAALGLPVGTVYSRLRAAREEFTLAVRRLQARRR
jgi:RNA polymerase sigma-70 factor (ECF subfamily)